MRAVQQPIVPCDLSDPAFLSFVIGLGVSPEDVTLIHADNLLMPAFEIAKKYGCRRVSIPREMLVSEYAWGVSHGASTMWSQGI